MAAAMQISNAFEEIAPPSTSASKKVPFDVFINHRGIDAKHTLASSIYTTLHGVGLQVFLDKEALELGDFIPSEIEEAMRTSFLHIAILSPNYANSPWCLAELSFMLKTGNTVIPVFYGVEPSDVRYIKGTFADAFSEYERKKRHTSEKLQDWKWALHTVSFHSGQILNGNDDEGRLLKSIVNCVMKHMKKVQMEVAKHPVGLDEAVHDFEKSVLDSSQKVQIVGIVGMGGSGKTTLATEIYNRKSSFIDKCSFLLDVRDAAYKNDLHNKQKKLMQDIGFNASQFDNVQEGKGILKSRLRSVQVFLVLDDVDHVEQLDALLPRIDSFEQGSLIIITSRELGILKSWGISSIYQMKKLNLKHARELLCWHAFLQSYPPDEFQNLVEKFVEICDGLPLSLKIFGGLLYKKPKEYWISQLSKASRLLPNDIKERLKISFDALDEEEQDIFLDIACFFIGEEKSLAIAVWDGSGWSGVHSWEVLENKCLADVDESNRIKMHDHLRDLGKEIAKGRPPYRVWSTQQVTDMQKQATQRVLIRGIKAARDDFYEECSFYHVTPFEECMELVKDCSARFRRLTPSILVVKENYFTEELGTLSAGLVWLRWIMFRHRALPSWLSLKNLRVLELHYAHFIEELWSDTAVPPLELRELSVVDAQSFSRFPRSIGYLKHLKKISLTSLPPRRFFSTSIAGAYIPIDNLPEEFCLLESLEHLELRACGKLTSLPSKFGHLTNLRYLDLSYCRELRVLPDSFKQLIHLQHINFHGCEELTLTPENNYILEDMTKLETLDFSECKKMQKLPLHITNQLSLRYVNVEGTRLRELPSNIGELSKLEVLKIGSELLTRLPTSTVNLSSLTSLKIYKCGELKTLPEPIGNLTSLTQFEIFYSRKLQSLPESMGYLSSLTSLIVYKCGELETLPDSIGNLSCLINLRISVCKKFKSLPDSIGNLSSLNSLYIFECEELESLPESIGNLSCLTDLRIWCRKLKSLPESMSHLSTLTILNINSCEKLESLPESIWNLSCLTTLNINSCDKLGSLPKSIWDLSSLTTLYISSCKNLESLPEPVESLNQLEPSIESTLEKSIPPKNAQLSNLQSLNIEHCPVTELAFLLGSFSSSLCNLKWIKLSNTHVSRISISQQCCPSLETLDLHSNDQLLEIETLPTSLKAIKLSKCKMLKSISGIHDTVNLERLSILECEKLDKLLADLVSLKDFEISQTAVQLKKMGGLENCTSVERLKAVTCCNVPAIQNLEHLERLQRLELLAACNISAIEPCLKTIKKWPSESIICARTERGVESVVNSFAFPGLTLIDSCVEEINKCSNNNTSTVFMLNCGQRRYFNAAAMVCFDINSISANTVLRFGNMSVSSFDICPMSVGEGKWVWIGVFTQPSIWLTRKVFQLSKKSSRCDFDDKVRGMLVMGEQERVVEAFNKLLLHFGAVK